MRAAVLAAAVVLATAVAIPALGGPGARTSASDSAKDALAAAKKADKASRRALRIATNKPRGPRGPVGPKGPVGDPGFAGEPGYQGDTGEPGGQGAVGSAVFGAAIPSGTTVRGVYGGRFARATPSLRILVGLPVRAPVALDEAHIGFRAGAPAPVADALDQCTGSYAEPSAPAGYACLYPNDSTTADLKHANVATLTATVLTTGAATAAANRFGFAVEAVPSDATKTMVTSGTWAYTAP
jgi:hypothetical protein